MINKTGKAKYSIEQVKLAVQVLWVTATLQTVPRNLVCKAGGLTTLHA